MGVVYSTLYINGGCLSSVIPRSRQVIVNLSVRPFSKLFLVFSPFNFCGVVCPFDPVTLIQTLSSVPANVLFPVFTMIEYSIVSFV